MSTVLAVFTDGRRECIVSTLASFDLMVMGDVSMCVIHDDSADAGYRSWLTSTYGDRYRIIGEPTRRRGFAGAIAHTWRWITDNAPSDAQFVWHQEDDFTYLRIVDLADLGHVLAMHPHLAQMALRRQPWNAEELRAGGVVETNPSAYVDCTDGEREWLAHRLFWTTNPALYRIDRCRSGWPEVKQSEGRYSLALFSDPDVWCAYWGARASGEWVRHIGEQRAGIGY